MARPLSSEKRRALLLAATQAIAEQSVLATTASIARRAGVAEGTLFTYFESKDSLFQALYLHLQQELADAVMLGYPHEADCRQRMEHIFRRYVSWGLTNPTGCFARARLSASGHVLNDTQALAMRSFFTVFQAIEGGVRDGVLINTPIEFVLSVMEHIAGITIEHAARSPEDAERHQRRGFTIAWRAMTV